MGALPIIFSPTVRKQVQDAAVPTNIPPPTLGPVNLGGPQLPALSAPTAPTVTPSQTLTDVGKLSQLRASGDGISQVHNPFGRAALRTADVLGSVFSNVIPALRGALTAVPGTAEHHNYLVRQAERNVAVDQSQDEQQTKTEGMKADTAMTEEKLRQVQNPTPDNSDAFHTVQTDDGVMQFNPKTGKYDTRVGDKVEKSKTPEQQAYEFALQKGANPLDALNQVTGSKNQHADNLPQQYLDALGKGDTKTAGLIQRAIHDTQVAPKIEVHNAEARPAVEPGTWQPMVGADGKQYLFNSKTGESRENTIGLSKPVTGNAKAKISSDEQKRADLAQNLNENINSLEDISKRRPELFGPLNGRITGMKMAAGTDDADIAKLMTINHQLGMATQGAHSMRSAQGVETAAHSLTNGYHNSPEALRSSLEAARSSVQTFLQNSANPGQARSGLAVSLKDAMNLPQNKGKSEADVRADIQSHGHEVRP